MATGNPLKGISDQVTCSLCLEHYKDPVTLGCGHNFCRACITQSLEKAEARPSCPQCRRPISQRNFRTNHQLANLVELVENLEQKKQEEEERGVCGKHQKLLKLFNKEDQTCNCVLCDKCKEHKAPNVLPVDEASQEYKKKIKSHIPSLVDKRKELEALHFDEEQKIKNLQVLLKMERQNGLSAFVQLQRTLEENKHTWLNCLDDLEKELEKDWGENHAELLNQITDLSSLIAEMEQKCHQPADKYQQGAGKTLDSSRCKSAKERSLVLKPPRKLDSTLKMLTHKIEAFKKISEEFQDSLEKAFQKAHVTLDQDTAHPCLSVSENQRKVTAGKTYQLLPYKQERFDSVWCVLGCEKFTTGRHYWDVEIEGDKATWVIGVARESVKRKGNVKFSLEEGIWALESHLKTLMSPSQIARGSLEPLSKIRVFLDYEAGHVTFCDAHSGQLIFTFSSACFAGEVVCPLFQLSWGTSLKCC